MEIKLDKDNYTKEEVQGLIEQLQGTIAELNTKVEEGATAIEKVKELEQSNLTNAIKLEATKAGLEVEDVFDLIDADSLEKAQAKINKLVEMKKKEKIDTGFKPDGKKSSNEYSKYEKDGKVEGMLSSKLSKLFG